MGNESMYFERSYFCTVLKIDDGMGGLTRRLAHVGHRPARLQSVNCVQDRVWWHMVASRSERLLAEFQPTSKSAHPWIQTLPCHHVDLPALSQSMLAMVSQQSQKELCRSRPLRVSAKSDHRASFLKKLIWVPEGGRWRSVRESHQLGSILPHTINDPPWPPKPASRLHVIPFLAT